jgi:hypothetical protein
MGIPLAYICHQSSQRIRIKIASCKGDSGYFERLTSELARLTKFERFEVNALTGSVLIIDNEINIDDITNFAASRKLFDLTDQEIPHSPATARIASQLKNVNANIRTLTAGEMDLAGILLLALLISGVFQLLKGDFRMPPWHTAFWYAFGLYQAASMIKEDGSKSI